MALRAAFVAAFAGVFAANCHAAVVINEFVYDDSGGDTIEFVELYNSGPSAADISGCAIVGIDDGVTSDCVYTIPASTILPVGAFYTIGMAGVPNLDLDVTALPDMQNDMESLSLISASGAVLDSVVYERGKADRVIPAGLGEPPFNGISATSGGGIWATILSVEHGGNDGGGFATGGPFNATFSWGRWPDGQDTNNNELDFHLLVASPGSPNGTAGLVNPASFPVTFTFDEPDGTTIPAFAGSRASLITQDPSTSDPLGNGGGNPSVIAPSPQGGNVGVFWNAAGGRNPGILQLTQPVLNVRCECYFFFPNPFGFGQSEGGTIFIVRGRPDGTGFMDPLVNGDTGIRLRWKNDEGGIRVFCEERRNGVTTQFGSDAPVFSAGWQRVMLQVSGTDVRAAYGGSFGTDTGLVTMTGSTTLLRPGGIGFSYEEGVIPDTLARPNTYDEVVFSTPLAATVEDWSIY